LDREIKVHSEWRFQTQDVRSPKSQSVMFRGIELF
jgi:hypothetical protein